VQRTEQGVSTGKSWLCSLSYITALFYAVSFLEAHAKQGQFLDFHHSTGYCLARLLTLFYFDQEQAEDNHVWWGDKIIRGTKTSA
jgi:hypothetical protein